MAQPYIITLNQLIAQFRLFSQNHIQLNDFGYGMTSDIGTTRQMEMPYMWVTHEQDSSYVIANKVIEPQINLTFLFVDKINNQRNFSNRVGEDSNNGQEVISDMELIARDFLTYVNNSLGQYGISFASDASGTVIQDETDDKVNGWMLRLSFKLKFTNCEIPE